MSDTTIHVAVRGTRPLLQNAYNIQLANLAPSKNGKLYDDMQEAKSRLILDHSGNICQPASHFEAALVNSATEYKFKGSRTYKQLFKAGIVVSPDLIPHKTRDWVIDKRPVVVAHSRILRCRPRFDDWKLEFDLIISDELISPLIAKQILVNAGKKHGIGDYRPRFGLFEVDNFDLPNVAEQIVND